jgi:hypothetical protein
MSITHDVGLARRDRLDIGRAVVRLVHDVDVVGRTENGRLGNPRRRGGDQAVLLESPAGVSAGCKV